MKPLRVRHAIGTTLDGQFVVIRALSGGPMCPGNRQVAYVVAGPFPEQIEADAAAIMLAADVRSQLEQLGLEWLDGPDAPAADGP